MNKNLNDYLPKSNGTLLQNFKWGSEGENDFNKFMSLVREQSEKVKQLEEENKELQYNLETVVSAYWDR